MQSQWPDKRFFTELGHRASQCRAVKGKSRDGQCGESEEGCTPQPGRAMLEPELGRVPRVLHRDNFPG